MSEPEYKRLTFSRRRHDGLFTAISTVSSLWLGSDHLLMIDSNRFIERYKRFYFRDIQALTILRTNRRQNWNIALGVLTFASLLTALALPAAGAIFAAIFLGLILFNQALGPTATAYIRTAVQVEELPSLNRIRRAQDALDKIRPLIAAAQGELPAEESLDRLRQLQSAAGVIPFRTSPLNLSS